MNTQVIFWLLVSMGLIEIIAIFLMGTAIRSLVTSDMFKTKIQSMKPSSEKETSSSQSETETPSSNSNSGSVGLAILAILLPSMAYSQTAEATADAANGFSMVVGESELYVALIINVILLAVLLFMKRILTSLLQVDKKPVKVEEPVISKGAKRFMQILTDAVPVEEEEKVETDHEYDGIRELDNNLPPWWKWGFYVTIVVAIFYLINFHVLKTGDLQIAEYNKSMEKAQEEVNAYLISQALNVDEHSVVALLGEEDLNKGKGLFIKYCKVCHGEYGEGLVGPNMTDDYWIYGNDIKNIFKTVKYGAKNGMKSWKDELNPVQMQQVASFIQTLQGTNPPNQKEPQGDKYEKVAPEGGTETAPEGDTEPSAETAPEGTEEETTTSI